ncbi:DUF3108 domain-containing protein [Mucilaginibacter arboris]|uniref:DUF3108 domain-containing protein n=1 Tax=Mucilaginibacter arboris TaxID=2682090 RepID=A0A7K1SRQ1_9SPHI|nr:DUF3108 domain-containing protein [Mucilaginibacter arboris]MVN19983.1 DUF3108 domain-containing protein [Mucilaginibacter arboris]
MAKILWVPIAFIIMLHQLVAAQELVKKNTLAFKDGEQLSYRLKYGIFSAAEANLRIEESGIKFDGNPTYHIIVDGRTAGSFDVFFKVRNRYESFIDRTTTLPYYYTENRREGKYRRTDKVSFDYENKKITAQTGTFPFKGMVFDLPSAFYFARNLDLSKIKVGEELTLQYFSEKKVETLGITYLGKETVTCDLGTFNCLKFSPAIVPGRIFRKDSKLYLWITNDGNRIPIKAQVEILVGTVTLEITNAKGLKYPLNP